MPPVDNEHPCSRVLEQRRLERGHRQIAASVLTLALPVPLLRDLPWQHAVSHVGMNPQRLRQIGVECRSVGGDGRLKNGIARIPSFGTCWSSNHAVIETYDLAPVSPDLAGKDMARNAASVPTHDVFWYPGDPGDPVDERVAGRKLALQRGEADEVIRQREPFDH